MGSLLYANQFVLGPRFVERFSSWQRFKIREAAYLTVHPGLSVRQVSNGDKSLTLLGYMLDPERPRADDGDILDGLIKELTTAAAFFGKTSAFGGRWILIVDDGREIRLFNDAVGLRQVFYNDRNITGEFWCASQPEPIAGMLGLSMDGDAVDFVDSFEFRTNPEFRWPGEATMYRKIRHMLPNHYLDLKTGRCLRYWPWGPLPDLDVDEAREKAGRLLRGLMLAASHRFSLALSVTAGLDSRLVLAASREVSRSMTFMTVRQISMPEAHADIATPAELTGRLGLGYDVVKSSLILDDDFIDVFKKNVSVPHYVYAPDAQAILKRYGRSKVAVTGSTSEVSRSSFRALLNRPKYAAVTIEDFSRLQQMGVHPFAAAHYERWLAGIGERHNVDILNLFEWELDDGNWLAMCQLEFDIAWKDIFTPFNCRELITTLLGVDDQHMRAPAYELYKGLISDLWPDVLCVPVNPHKMKKVSFSSKLKSRIRSGLLRVVR
jgi:hypothetical protein